MGKSLPSTAHLQDLARLTSKSSSFSFHKRPKPSRSKPIFPPVPVKSASASARRRAYSERVIQKMEAEGSQRQQRQTSTNHVPLSDVVSDCVKRWFQETLKEARGGDTGMQVLVGQMYYSGYGVPRDVQKGRAWITKASKARASAWKVSDKHPGYNASDSDSDELKDDLK